VTASRINKRQGDYSNSSSFMLYSQLKISSEVACFLLIVIGIFFNCFYLISVQYLPAIYANKMPKQPGSLP